MKYHNGPIVPFFSGVKCCVCGENYEGDYYRDPHSGEPLYYDAEQIQPLDQQTYMMALNGMLDVKWFCGPICSTKAHVQPDVVRAPLAILASKV